jgi:hypothetical protein
MFARDLKNLPGMAKTKNICDTVSAFYATRKYYKS